MAFVAFDINHTLVEENSWVQLNIALGMTEAEDQVLWDLNQEGIVTNDLWVQIVNNLYQKRGRATRETIERAVLDYTYIDGARECVAQLQADGHTLALLSGGPDIFVRAVAKDLGIKLWRAGGEFLFHPDGRLARMVYADEEVPKKVHNLVWLCDEADVELKDAICIGDGANEAALFEIARGITFQGSKVADRAWKVVNSLADVPATLRG